MSLEPKPRSMAAVTITVLRWIAALEKFDYLLEYLADPPVLVTS